MKTIGMIGGITWNSTAEYYRIINQTVADILGGSHSAEILMYSFDFNEVEAHQSAGEWDILTDKMVDRALRLKNAGADFIVICANTMHKMASAIETKADIPVLHIADVTGKAIQGANLNAVTLLGTRYVMEGDFYTDILKNKYGLTVHIPDKRQREQVHQVIYDELVIGKLSEISKRTFIEIIDSLTAQGSQGVVLGCTEIPLLIKQSDLAIPVFSTSDLHAIAAAKHALSE